MTDQLLLRSVMEYGHLLHAADSDHETMYKGCYPRVEVDILVRVFSIICSLSIVVPGQFEGSRKWEPRNIVEDEYVPLV